MAFSDIEKNEKLNPIDIAIVENENFSDNIFFKEAFSNLENGENEDKLFNITYTNIDNSKKMLDNKEITGYLVFTDDIINITVNNNGINETILKFVVDEISSKKTIVENLIESQINNNDNQNSNMNYDSIYLGVNNLIMQSDAKINNISNKNLSYTMIEYYTLIAMSILYGGIISMFITNYKLANMNSVGKRTTISPLNRGKNIIGSLFASYIVELFGLMLLFLYTIFVLKVDYGDRLNLVVLLSIVGAFFGLTLGVFCACVFKKNENFKTGILIAFTMFCCFFSGMMGITMKYVIDKNVPILNKLNPASMITDGFYSLYYYETLDRFYFNLMSLLIFSLILVILSYKALERQSYDSI